MIKWMQRARSSSDFPDQESSMGSKTAYLDTFAADRLPPPEQWPAFLFELPELKYAERLNCASALIDDAVTEGYGEKVAVYSDEGQVSYDELLALSNQVAQVLTDDLGLVPGNRVLLRAPNCTMLVASWLGVMKAGGIAVTTMPLLRSKELQLIAEKCQIDHALCDDRLLSDLDSAAAGSGLLNKRLGFGQLNKCIQAKSGRFINVDTYKDDISIIAFTSGTTGEPKATMHFHRDILAMADTVGRHLLKTRPADIYTGSPPLGFTFGLGALLVFPLRFRAATALVESPKPENLLNTIQRCKVTTLFSTPMMYGALESILSDYDISSLQQCVSAGETLPAPISKRWFRRTNIRIIDGIGATEMIHIFIGAAGANIRPGSTGKPIPGYTACILDENNRPLPPGNIGRLAVKGPTGCRYLADKRQTEYVVNGWNVTGDVYRLDEDGYFWFQARNDDMILSAGYNIAGPEVESALLSHNAVSSCAVVGVPDELRGNIVKAFIVLNNGFQPSEAMAQELQSFVKESIAPYKYPRKIEFVESLPKTQTGKLQRYRLRQAASIK